MEQNKLEVVLTPALLPLYEAHGKIVVVIDILRATSSMCVAFHTGVTKILPVSTPRNVACLKTLIFCARPNEMPLKYKVLIWEIHRLSFKIH